MTSVLRWAHARWVRSNVKTRRKVRGARLPSLDPAASAADTSSVCHDSFEGSREEPYFYINELGDRKVCDLLTKFTVNSPKLTSLDPIVELDVPETPEKLVLNCACVNLVLPMASQNKKIFILTNVTPENPRRCPALATLLSFQKQSKQRWRIRACPKPAHMSSSRISGTSLAKRAFSPTAEGTRI